MSDNASSNREALEILLGTLEENPDLWETRKKTARLLFVDERYLEAADILWGAPEIPATDVDVAFALQVISRVKPNRSIRLVYEVLRRNQGKPLKNMAVARALNEVGLYMEAARFYGAAIAEDAKFFNIAFERQMLWMDDSKRLIEEWKDTDQEAKIPLDVPEQEISGGMIRPSQIHNEIDAIAEGVSAGDSFSVQQVAPATGQASNAAAPQPRRIAPVPTQPLVSPKGMKKPPEPMEAPEILSSTAGAARQAVASGGAPKPNPLLTPAAGDAPVRPALNTGVPMKQEQTAEQKTEQDTSVQAQPSSAPSDESPSERKGGSRPLLVAGAGANPEQASQQTRQAAEEQGAPAPQKLAQSEAGTARPLLVAGGGAKPANKLLTPGATNKTNMLIPGNASTSPPPEGGEGNPQDALNGEGTPLSASNANVPQAQSTTTQGMQGGSATEVMMPQQTFQAPLQVVQQSATPMLRRPQTAAPQAGTPMQPEVMQQQATPVGMMPPGYVAVPVQQVQQAQAGQPPMQRQQMMGMPQSPQVMQAPQGTVPMGTQPMVMVPVQQAPGMPVSTQVMMVQPGSGLQRVPQQMAQPAAKPATPPPAGPRLNLK